VIHDLVLRHAVITGAASALHIGGGIFPMAEFEALYQNIRLLQKTG